MIRERTIRKECKNWKKKKNQSSRFRQCQWVTMLRRGHKIPWTPFLESQWRKTWVLCLEINSMSLLSRKDQKVALLTVSHLGLFVRPERENGHALPICIHNCSTNQEQFKFKHFLGCYFYLAILSLSYVLFYKPVTSFMYCYQVKQII